MTAPTLSRPNTHPAPARPRRAPMPSALTLADRREIAAELVLDRQYEANLYDTEEGDQR